MFEDEDFGLLETYYDDVDLEIPDNIYDVMQNLRWKCSKDICVVYNDMYDYIHFILNGILCNINERIRWTAVDEIYTSTDEKHIIVTLEIN